MPATLAEIASLLQLPPPANGSQVITGMATLKEAAASELSFLGQEKYVRQFPGTKAAAVIVQRRVKLPPNHGKTVLTVDDTDLAVATVLALFAPPVPVPPTGVDTAARVDASASVGAGSAVAHNVTIGARARIGRNCVLHPGVYIGNEVTLGDDCTLYPNVVIRERCTLGNRVIIHANSTIGTDGFGYRWDGERHVKVPQIGTVVIEDDVEIGSSVCVDRAKVSTTRIGRGTKIDNLVQVGHNVVIGRNCIITGQVGLAGSVTLGANVVLGGQSAVRDHVTVNDGAMVAGCAGVAEDIDAQTIVSGLPALPHRQSLREQAALRRLPELVMQVRKLRDQIEQLQRGPK